MDLLETLKNRILVADGAMGTLLYAYGADTCYESFNLTHPEDIHAIHRAYIEAGASVIQTNTYSANYIKLAQYGLEEKVKDINKAAVQIAKEAANRDTFILGTVGGIRGQRKTEATLAEIKRTFREQIFHLLNEGVDALLLETYFDAEELYTVVDIAKKEADVPVIAQFSLIEPGVLQNGTPVRDAFKELENRGADVTGLNCRLGPHHMIQAFEEIPIPKRAFLSAYPNASLLDYEEGRFTFTNNADYFKTCAEKLVEQGVRLIGGCCGTTPAHIKAIADGVQGLLPVTEKTVRPPKIEIAAAPAQHEPPLHEIVKKRRSVIVELDTPKTLNTARFFEGAKALHDAGIDALTMADNSLASPRISNTAIASILKEKHGIRPLVHITCRDRNLIGLQSHLMGLAALGIDQVLAITGDPTKIGDFPGATSVYDLSSMELIAMIKQFNDGISHSGKSLHRKTNFSVAAAFNPNVRNLDKTVGRLERKIRHGADYFITQPVFSTEKIEQIHEATKHLDAPIYLGIMPLTSYRNAVFLHNEVPGIKLTDEILAAMEKTNGDPAKAREESLAISRTLIDAALGYFNGIYLITPLERYELTVECTRYIHEKTAVQGAGIV
ncbi:MULTISPECIES: bifunctional homocysteine S-methyltransferase/methylenetetrahydrofolate reductase [Heyndrickxia]|uniref:bifunctional homocysteine S-methyltransferase/methylenetetrahydrofolate reductase n=1 Tax=Heyndrickxia TaxID=2837504 RepID=UPI000D7350BB|nr:MULTISPECIES: bifunctional homocysteine S-methyltransferase/methylenetetrahydrofolate reductase [Heyndrickxia]AWP35934.1 bifunctional homocysteine S-methyltransferase/methylenetetrahydrofolate reductase [Heyndrickxia coagulans]MBQ4912445.1 bifunctional homocysteine S-methyltransferase/methylenetetrahydrofolate reductase [Heyndrickxia faecalis]MED4976454.1 bifunctional homocysteine S-methyltransferase/methylenetetrahydrofolate reductase [Weizmannia sp. CD-2023]QDI61432.1 bifunctional homocyst